MIEITKIKLFSFFFYKGNLGQKMIKLIPNDKQFISNRNLNCPILMMDAVIISFVE